MPNKKKKDMVMSVNGKEADLSKALPLKVKDWRKLKERGVDVVKMSGDNLTLENIIDTVHYILEKANPDIKIDDVEELDISELVKIHGMTLGEEEVDRPT